MDKRAIKRNTEIAFIAQGFSFSLSIIQSLLVPKILGLKDYSYWQLFIFYSSYVGFFHLGLNDGVYLIKGGQSRDQIDKSSVFTQFIIGLALEVFEAMIIVITCRLMNFDQERLFIINCTAVFLIVQNSALYFMFILQAMNETKLSSYSIILNRATFLIPLIIYILGHIESYKYYVIAYVFSASIQLIYSVWCCRDIVQSKLYSISFGISEVWQSIHVGSRLMLANIASQLVIGILRATIDAQWGIETFGKLSLSISMVNFFLAFVSQAAMVLFPALRQSGDKEVRTFYIVSRDALSLFFPAVYLLYFPMVWLLSMWLPEFIDSFKFFALLIPICVFDSRMNITCTTMFKVRREESLLLRINVLTTLFTIILVSISVFILNSIELAIVSTTIAIIGRSMLSERIVANSLEISNDDITIWEIVLTILFMTLSYEVNVILAEIIMISSYTIYLIYHRNSFYRVKQIIRI